MVKQKTKKKMLSLLVLVLTFTNGNICGLAAPQQVNIPATPNLMDIQKNTLPINIKCIEYDTPLQKIQQQQEQKALELAQEEERKRIEEERLAQISKQDRIIDKAEQYLGVPYVWGGTTPKGFDCSGFVQYVYNSLGYNLSRTSKSQAAQGRKVSLKDIQKGDLVFFGSPVHHVGIYIGDNQYIHAPHTGDVIKISNLNSRKDLTCVKRIIS